MRKLLTAGMSIGLLLGATGSTPLLAQGKGGGGGQKGQGPRGKQTGPRDGTGKQTAPKDGTGKQQGKGPSGKQAGPKDGTGPIHTPTPKN